MIDGIIKANGTSRLMRAELPATYEEFRAQCRVGAQPLDVLFNALGWSQLPTFLNKANLLKDTTSALFGLGANAVPDDVFAAVKALIDSANANANTKARVEVGTYTGTGGTGTSGKTKINFSGTPKVVVVLNEGSSTSNGYSSNSWGIFVRPLTKGGVNTISSSSAHGYYAEVEWGSNSIAFYNTATAVSAGTMLNHGNHKYYYWAVVE